ncbi:helix-turn-helix transcriptional regulator [Leuconostoc gelidum subsp. gasicomitatum]|uniref:helix-turn-helix domain-containing protein n=1 Tax=Leuconostoc gasicomitatum TaxID=115778 RepID=UPI001CC38892|nr:helix-turn-helix transcriptional regulator [Leuconostoc gasicomitatum]MBZ5965583.1 helix-turn-helix transcriptional regulator [Leuconostoc gasicomitatum]
MNFGQKLQTARINMHLTQQKVADDFFITRQTISSWENDNSYPDVMTLIKLSDYFGFSIDEILREDKQMRLFLDKKAVKNDLKPIYRILLLTSFILLVIELGGMLGWTIWGVVMLSIHAFDMLSKFDATNTMGFKYTWQRKIKALLHL